MSFIPVNERQLAFVVNVAGQFGVNIRHTNIEFGPQSKTELGADFVAAVEEHADELLAVMAKIAAAAEPCMNEVVTHAAAAGDESASKALGYWPDEQPEYEAGGYLKVCGRQIRGEARVQPRRTARKPSVKVQA
jgi:hypothetical protein